MYDVIIVGGGPVGSFAAHKLAGAGYEVAVLEQKQRLEERVCCTGVIGQECVTAFAIDDNVILRQVNSAKLFSPSGRLLSLWRPETQASIIVRAAFDKAMATRAQGNGVEYILNSVVRDIETRDDMVRIEATCHEERLNFTARAAIIATGFGSRLSEGLGLGKIGDFVTGAQAEVETTGLDEIEAYFGQEIAPGFFAWLVPTSSNRALVGLLSRHSPGLYLKKFMSSLVAQGKIASAEAELGYGGIPLKPLPRTYSKRLLVVGSAAGQVKPTTGGGIYYGLLCANMAANTLHSALESDDLSARRLANYQREWKKKLGQELRIGYWARKFFEHLSDGQIDRIFDIIKRNGIDDALSQAEDLSFDWHGKAVLRLLQHRAMSKGVEAMKIPLHLRRKR